MKRTISYEGSQSSGNRTLIQRMGFNDPDHQDSKHDLACKYLSEDSSLQKIVNIFYKNLIIRNKGKIDRSSKYNSIKSDIYLLEECLKTKEFDRYNAPWRNDYIYDEIKAREAIDKLKSIIINVEEKEILTLEQLENSISLEVKFEMPIGSGSYIVGFSDIFIKAVSRYSIHHFLIEVKSAPISASEILRQINFYRKILFNGHSRSDHTILAHIFNMSKSDADILRRENIVPIFLGKSFIEWCDIKKNEKECNTFEI